MGYAGRMSGGEGEVNYGSVCAGIEAASVAWKSLGWQASWFSEIEPFCCAVLAQHYPDVPNLGDMTKFQEWSDYAIDVLVGGTPCQSFSVAGLRAGMDDPRGNLALVYLAVAARYRPRWVVWENVPGVLSSGGGRDFGAFLGALGQLGYGFAYRVLDAQYFGVAQRRRRVFVVGHLGDWRRAAAVLFEQHSLSGYPPPSRTEGEVTPTIPASGAGTARTGGPRLGCEEKSLVSALGFTKRGGRGLSVHEHTYGTLDEGQNMPLICFEPGNLRRRCGSEPNEDCAPTLGAQKIGDTFPHIADQTVRRLTPRECERLQGFPDDYTAITYRGKPAYDGPKYRALGNSMAVPVMRWIGERIQKVEAT